MLKKFALPLLIGVCILISVLCPTISASADGIAEFVIELSTRTILSCKNETAKMPMASTTKIMTALLIVEDCDLNDVIIVPDEAVGVEGSSISLKYGEEISIRDLVYGLMLRSGNDSAVALAIYHSGNVQNFVDAMNNRAKEMGAHNTQFKNPSGLPDNEHYTTASDLGIIACNAMSNKILKMIVSTKHYSGDYRSFVNKNKILAKIDGANGVKTGYTVKAGKCLVSSVERDRMDIICVVLNCPDMYKRSIELIEDAFNEYELKTLSEDKIFMCGIVPCKLDNNYNVLLKKSDGMHIEVTHNIYSKKIKNGDLVGEILIYSENSLIFRQNLYSIIDRK